ncbi:MAG: translation initiation factor IF-2 [Mycoplasma sp.]|nr:translation initiation factor IF-2 [Mycoplasma sp.]
MKKRKDNFDSIKQTILEKTPEIKNNTFIFTNPLSIIEFAKYLNKSANEIIGHFFNKGQIFTINQTLNEEQMAEYCLEIGLDFKKEKQIDIYDISDEFEILDDIKELQPRPPIVAIMGHVDHGKTTLLDYIRTSKTLKVTTKEFGGITQHIGAYQVSFNNKFITFLDTPGHEAFVNMRARGSRVTDIVVLVVAGDEGVNVQTKEVIDHILNIKAPTIVFINKMDKPDIDVEKVKGDLAKLNIVPEEWGGKYPFVLGSAKTGLNVDKLLDTINLMTDLLDLKFNPNRYAYGYVIEAKIDKFMGPIATLLIKNGTLLKTDFVVAGFQYGRVRKMVNYNNQELKEAQAGMPILISGLNFMPEPGEIFFACSNEKEAKKIADAKKTQIRQKQLNQTNVSDLGGSQKTLNVILKADVHGSLEALKYSVIGLEEKNEEIKINIISSSVGTININDLSLAKSSKAIILAFNTLPDANMKKIAQNDKVKIVTANVIYLLIENLKTIKKDLENPKYEEKIIGKALVLKVFYSSKIGQIVGAKVIDGMAKVNVKVQVLRNQKQIAETRVDSLQKEKDVVRQVKLGYEFGCHLANFDQVQDGDELIFIEEIRIN